MAKKRCCCSTSCFPCFSARNSTPSSSSEGASSAVVKQDDPSPGDTASSSIVQALDVISTDLNAFEGENVDVDLNRLINHISDLLELIKENKKNSTQSKPDYRFWPTTSKSINKVKDFLSEATNVLKDIIPGDAKTIVRGLLQNMGTAHLATTGLLVVSNVLERFEDVSNNWDECFRLLKEMIFLAKVVKQIKERPQLKEGMHDEVKTATELILEGSIMCCSQMRSSKFARFFSTSVSKEALVKLTQQLDDMYKHIYVQMGIEIYNVNQCKTASVSRLYPKHAVGIDEAIREVIDILEWGSEENALAVILHGFGGMGKSTLAQAVFSKLEIKDCKYSKVELFENINSSPKIIELQNKILKDLMGTGKVSEISNHMDGQLELDRTLEKVQAFIYIDNVLGVEELRQLLPHDMNKAKKVRLLITARDLNVRKACPMKTAANLYPMKGMSSTDAMSLLQKEMFDDPERILDSKQVDHTIKKCGGIPLMLKLVAGAVRVAKDKPQEVGEVMEELENLKGEDFGPGKIESYFFAYDKLPEDCKDPFLDICSFFHGWDRGTVADILGESELKMLESRALVTQDTNGVVSVHDIILALGCRKSQELRFRFTNAGQVQELLDHKEEKDIQAIKGIWLSKNKNPLDISASKLNLMCNSLRVLALGSLTQVKGECSKIFEKLVFFQAEITHLSFDVSKLKGLKYLNFKPKDLKLSEMPSSLRHMELDGSLHSDALQVTSTDLQQFGNLRKLRLINFEKFKILPKEMGYQVNVLRELSLSGCTSIEQLPESISKLRSLQILRMDMCVSLTELPADFGSLNSLQELHLQLCFNLKALPNSVEKLSSLKLLNLSFCHNLLNLPPGLGNLACLVKLNFNQCLKLESIPESIRELKLLQPILDMSDCWRLKDLPHGFCNLSYITHLSLARCSVLEKLPDGFGKLTSLRALDLQYCTTLEKLPEGFGQLKCLEELVLKDCQHLRELCDDFHCLSSLQNLDLSGCRELEKLPGDFHCLASLQHLYLCSCNKLEGKWMDHVVKLNRLQIVHIEGSEQLVKKWAEIQREVHRARSFVVTAGQDLSMSEDQKENIEMKLLSEFDHLLRRGEPVHLCDLPPDTLLLVVCDVCPYFNIFHFPWRLIEETINEIQIQFQIIYMGPHFSKLPTKVKDRIFVGHMSETRAREVVEKVYLTSDAGTSLAESVRAYELRHYFQLHTKMVGEGNSDKYLLSWKLLTDSEMEESLFGNCRRYLRLKQLVETPHDSNVELLKELFTHEDKESTPFFQKNYPSQQGQTGNSKPFTCGVDKLKGKNILLELRPPQLFYDIRLSSLKKMYVMEKERLDVEIISIPIVEAGTELDVFDVYKQFSTEVPWLVLQNSWMVVTRTVLFFLAKQCGWERSDECEKCYPSIIFIIEQNGRITSYKPSILCKLNKWEILFNHLESVSYQVRWGAEACPFMHDQIEELRKEEWKQLNSMSTLMFLFNHLDSVSNQVKEVMFQSKIICLYSGGFDEKKGFDEKITSSIKNAMIELRDSIHIIYIPGNMKTICLTDTIKKDCYYPWGKTAEMEGMSLLNLSGDEAVRFWMRLLHLKQEINGMDDNDKQFCEMRRLLHSFPLVDEDLYAGYMIFMYEDGKIVATCSTTIMKWLFLINSNREDRAKRLMQLLIKVSMEEGKHMHLTNNMQTAATTIDKKTVDLDLDSLNEYTSELLEHEELYQLFEFNKEGERLSRPKDRHHWPTSIGFSMLKNFLSDGINTNWVKDAISRHPKEDKWKTVTKSLLKGIGETHWAAAGLLAVAYVLERFETVSANRNECLFLLDEMNRLAIYLKQLSKMPGSWTGMKRESIGSIMIGSIICCAQIDPSKFAMFVGKSIDNNLLSSFQRELQNKCDMMANSITEGLGSESGSLLKTMCKDWFLFVTGDLASENENKGGPSVEDESGPSSMALLPQQLQSEKNT